MADDPIVCRYIRQGRHFVGLCEELEITVGPYLSRDDAEASLVREVKKVLDLDELACFRHLATEAE